MHSSQTQPETQRFPSRQATYAWHVTGNDKKKFCPRRRFRCATKTAKVFNLKLENISDRWPDRPAVLRRIRTAKATKGRLAALYLQLQSIVAAKQ